MRKLGAVLAIITVAVVAAGVQAAKDEDLVGTWVVEKGEADFAKDIAADLPLLTLADVFGVPESDRWLMFDWANRVIGYQDLEYSVSAAFDPAGATDMARRAITLRPSGPVNSRPS